MARIWFIRRTKEPESEQVTNFVRISSGGAGGETLLPSDIGLRTIEYFNPNAITRIAYVGGHGSFSLPMGSLYHVLGTPERSGAMSGISKAVGGLGSGVLIVWQKIGGTGAFSGTPAAGSKTLVAEIIGRM